MTDNPYLIDPTHFEPELVSKPESEILSLSSSLVKDGGLYRTSYANFSVFFFFSGKSKDFKNKILGDVTNAPW